MKKVWHKKEDDLLRKFWTSTEKIETWAANIPGRSFGAIYQRARLIGMGKRDCVTRSHPKRCWIAIKISLEKRSPQTMAQLSKTTGYSESRIGDVLANHRDRGVYIVDYVMHKASLTAMWACGEGRSKRKPKKTRKQIGQEYLKRARERSPEMFDRRNARKRIKRAEERGKLIRPDAAAAWMMNPTK